MTSGELTREPRTSNNEPSKILHIPGKAEPDGGLSNEAPIGSFRVFLSPGAMSPCGSTIKMATRMNRNGDWGKLFDHGSEAVSGNADPTGH